MEKSNQTRRKFLFGGTGVFGALGLGLAGFPFFAQMSPANDTEDPNVSIDLRTIGEGDQIKFLVGSDIVIVRHLSPGEALSFSPPLFGKYVVLSAKCPNGFCVVYLESDNEEKADEKSYWYCPCCNASFDLLGNHIHGGPSDRNLEIPSYDLDGEYFLTFRPNFA